MAKIHKVTMVFSVSRIAFYAFAIVGTVAMLWGGYALQTRCYELSLVGATAMLISKLWYDRLRKTVEELPEPLKEVADACHGDTLTEVMEALRDERLEYNVACSLDGKVITEGTYLSPDHTNITRSGWSKIRATNAGYINLHNHPNLYECPFSSSDMMSFVKDDLCECMVVVTTHFNYILRMADNATRSSIKTDELKRDLDTYETRYSEKVFLSHAGVRRDCIRQVRQIAKSYGFEFTVEDLRVKKTVAWIKTNQKRLTVAFGCIGFLVGIFCSPVVTTHHSVTPTVSSAELANDPPCGHVDPPMD